MRTIITFLNDKGLKAGTFYTWQGREYEGGVFSLALRQFVEHDQMLVCNTPEAEKNTWPDLLALDDSRIKSISIPKGETTTEMWEIFNTITEQVGIGDTVIFDITHGLRSLPFLVFLFAAYLKSAKAVNIEAIYYGAYELRKPAPVIDLSEFITILDWLTATNRFVETGDGQLLANLLKKGIPTETELEDDLSAKTLGDNLKLASEAIESISLALRLNQPVETMEQSTNLESALTQSAPSIDQKAKPFAILAKKVLQEYNQFALEAPRNKSQLVDNLWLQFEMIKWYVERQQIIQAITLVREWIVSVLTLKFGEEIFDDKKGRSHIERALSNVVREKNKPNPTKLSSYDQQFQSLSNRDELTNLWQTVTKLRNDIAHCGMNLSPKKASELKEEFFGEIYPKLPEIAKLLLPPRNTVYMRDSG